MGSRLGRPAVLFIHGVVPEFTGGGGIIMPHPVDMPDSKVSWRNWNHLISSVSLSHKSWCLEIFYYMRVISLLNLIIRGLFLYNYVFI